MPTGGEVLARMLQAEGVEVVFGIIDGTYYGFYASLHALGITLVTPRHEASAAHAAAAYARLTGKLGVCMASNGPGVANILPGLVVEQTEGNRVLCITSARRTALLPELPTVIEAGLPGYEVVTWNGILVAAATPQDIVQRLNAEIGKALKAQDARDQFINIGFDLIPGTPAQFAAYIREETAKWSRVIRQSGAKLD